MRRRAGGEENEEEDMLNASREHAVLVRERSVRFVCGVSLAGWTVI